MQVDGHQVAFPVMQSGQVAYYNADLLKELDITFPEKWEDMDAYLEKVFTATGKPAISLPEWDNAYFYPIYSNLNAYMITTNEKDEEVTGLDLSLIHISGAGRQNRPDTWSAHRRTACR